MRMKTVLAFVFAVVFSCQMCSLKHHDEFMFLKHVRVHKDVPYFVVECPFCKKKLKSVRGFKSHIDENHARSRAEYNHPDSLSRSLAPALPACDDTHLPGVPPDSITRDAPPFVPHVAIGNLMMEIRHEHNVPASVCSLIAQRMGNVLKRIGESSSPARQRKATVMACNRFKSTYKVNLFSNSIGFFQPTVVTLSEVGHMPKSTCQYISVKRQLTRLLQHGHLGDGNMPSRSHVAQHGTYGNIWDGSCHQMSKEYRDIRLLLYYDDFQVANPLGPHASKMKIGALYFTVANFSAVNRAKIRNIYLAALFRPSHIKRYGWNAILRPLIDDLKSLETEGLSNGVRVSLCAIVADNLASHSIGGLSQNFRTSACRFCLRSASDIRSATSLNGMTVNEDTFANEREKLERGERSVFQTTTPLTTLHSYSAFSSHPPDIGHDIFEGVAVRVLSLVLSSICLKRKYVSLERCLSFFCTVNTIMDKFQYSKADIRDKPSALLKKKGQIKIKQTMSGCWALLRLLPIMIGHLVRECGEWTLLIKFIRIVELIRAPVLREVELATLHSLTEDFLSLFLETFPDEHLTPKFHFMLHYAEETRKHGPLRHLWTFRFEQKNQMLKRKMEGNRCMKNVYKTLANKHEHTMAWYQNRDDYLSDDKICVVVTKKRGRVSAKRIFGQLYCLGCVVFVHLSHNAKACVIDEFLEDDAVLVHVYDLETYDRHRNAYILKPIAQWNSVRQCDFVTPYPVSKYGDLIVMHHYVPNFSS